MDRKYAQIYNGKVENTFLCDNYELANVIARCAFGNDAFAVEIEQYAVQCGDLYHNGSFWRVNEEGAKEEIPYIPTDSQQIQTLMTQISELQTENEELTLAIADMIGGGEYAE